MIVVTCTVAAAVAAAVRATVAAAVAAAVTSREAVARRLKPVLFPGRPPGLLLLL